MPTIISGRFDKDKAEKIYSNCVKGNPVFKPWKGKDGCAWFGYDGSPNPGAAARNKPVVIQATVNIPDDAQVITKTILENKLSEFLRETRDHFASAEGKLWTWVGQQGERAASGFLIVEVGKTALSPFNDGKYLLVNNHGMGKVQLSAQQQLALLNQLDRDTLEKLTKRQQDKEQLHGRVVHLTLVIPENKQNQYDPQKVGHVISEWAKSRCYTTDPVLSTKTSGAINKIAWGNTAHEVKCELKFSTYNQAKRNARLFVHAFIPITFEDKSTQNVPIVVKFGQGGAAYAYKHTGNVVSPPPLGAHAW